MHASGSIIGGARVTAKDVCEIRSRHAGGDIIDVHRPVPPLDAGGGRGYWREDFYSKGGREGSGEDGADCESDGSVDGRR